MASGTTQERTARSRPPRTGHRLFSTLKDDVVQVAGDIQRRGVRREIGQTLAGLEAFYLTAEDRQQLAGMKPVRRWIRRVLWLVIGLLMKLTPARRVMLAASLALLILQRIEINIDTVHVGFRFPLLGGLLLFAVLMLELKDKLIARDELEAGRQVQLAMMPAQKPHVPGWDVWLYTRPANDVGGDLVDHLQIDDRCHGVALGDVAGKALPAALLSVKLQATLRALAPRFDDLGALGDAVNHILQRDGLPTRFASLVYLLLSSDSGRVRLLNAGHMPPLLVRGSEVATLPRGSMVLGIMPTATFAEQAVELGPGDTLVVYSDGVTEAMNEAGDFFGDDRLLALAKRTAGLPVATLGQRILEDVAGFTGHAAANDDISLVVVRRTGNG